MKNLWEIGQKNNGDATLNWKASQYAQLGMLSLVIANKAAPLK